ncbi:SDR family oxidoreductase [Streptomyces sp. NPDC028722]|uniref:SDR family oxidoreductase n=1 Tax=Streptomyces sp. NPDC028722 TaxID=3155016 RepID=UPI0033DEDE7B
MKDNVMTQALPTGRAPEAGPVVVITGTSSGIGLASAIAAAQAGWTTVATLRDPLRTAKLLQAAAEAEVSLDVRQLDVTDERSVSRCIQSVIDDYGRLDALVNNAGAGHVGTVETDDMQAFRATVEVNFYGVVRTTREALPHLRASHGRIVTLSSVGGVVGQPFNEAYCAAKFAVEGFTEALAPVAAAVDVSVTLVEPGAVNSEFVANAGLEPSRLMADAGPYRDILSRYVARTMEKFGSNAQPAAEVAKVIVDVLGMRNPPLRVQTSAWSEQFVGHKLADADGAAVMSLTSGWLADA